MTTPELKAKWDAMAVAERAAVVRSDASMLDKRWDGLVARMSNSQWDGLNVIQQEAVDYLMNRGK